MTKDRHSLRDNSILLAVAVVVVAGYLVVKSPWSSASAARPTADMATTDHDGAMPSLSGFPETFEELVPMGNGLMDEGNYPMAAECYRRALEIRDDLDVRVDFGACLHGMGLADRAIEEFKRVVSEDPAHSIASFNLGIVYQAEQQPDSARRYFERYIEIDPNGPAAATARQLLNEL